jgi:hypothetical protein
MHPGLSDARTPGAAPAVCFFGGRRSKNTQNLVQIVSRETTVTAFAVSCAARFVVRD